MKLNGIKMQTADLIIELNVTCPKCDSVFDLLSTELNDEGSLIDSVICDSAWLIPAEERVSVEVICPECNFEFLVKGINW